MSASTAPNAPLRYRGYNSHYVDIAVRGADEHLGFAIEYAVHPSGVGCFILRFIAHGKGVDPKNYKHLTYRESAKFVIPATETSPTAEIFKGLRLTKIAIPVFKPAIQRHEVGTFGDHFNVWAPLTEWVAAQVAAEGFSLTVDLLTEIRSLLVAPSTPVGTVENVLQLPDLAAPEQKAAALKLVQKPEPEADESDDEDKDEDDKEWLN